MQEMIFYAENTQSILQKAKQYGISLSDEMVVDALAMNIGQIGEQLDSQKLSRRFQETYPDIEWRNIKRFRDKAYHHYGDMNSSMIIHIAQNVLPALITQLQDLLSEIGHE